MKPTMSYRPTDCWEKHGITEEDLYNQIGAETPLPEDAVVIMSADGVTVNFTVEQLWTEEASVGLVTVHYQPQVGESVCDEIPGMEYEDSVPYQAVCYEGYAQFSVYVHFDHDLEIGECEGCQAPEPNSTQAVAYYFEVSCEPLCAPLTDFPTGEPTAEPSSEPTPVPTTSVPSASPSLSMEPTICIDKATADLTDSIGASIE